MFLALLAVGKPERVVEVVRMMVGFLIMVYSELSTIHVRLRL